MSDAQTPDPGEAPSRPAVAPGRAKSFLRIGLEVVLITAGVFLGLLGEQWRQDAEHREMAQQALRRFRAEFLANTAEVNRVHGRHLQQVEGLTKYLAEHQPELLAHMLDVRKPVPLPVPDMVTDSAGVAYSAWDVALATQSLAHLDPDLVALMSSAYRMQQMYEAAHRAIQQRQYAADAAIPMMRGHLAYFGDASLYEGLLLKQYQVILDRLEQAIRD